MKLDSQNPFEVLQFVEDNRVHYRQKFECSNEWSYCNDPDAFDRRAEENEESIIEDMVEAYQEKLREEYNF